MQEEDIVTTEEQTAEESIQGTQIEQSPTEEATETSKTKIVEAEIKVLEPEEYHPYPKHKPYHERYYLRYGYEKMPESISTEETKTFLMEQGYANNFLIMARNGKNLAEIISKTYRKDDRKTINCDFCGEEILGTEFDIIKDGRKRCSNCSRSLITKVEEFVSLFNDILSYMKLFFGIEFVKGITVEMVNARTLHKKLHLNFVPTSSQTARVLGVAIKDKKKGYKILVENASPRNAVIQTLVHELTHIWQYENWSATEIVKNYGPIQRLEIYEGMAKWVEIQYMFLLGEFGIAKRIEMETILRKDEYGRGFMKYTSVHPISYGMSLEGTTPFDNVHKPL